MTICKLAKETHRALRARAANHGHSTEAEVRDILEAAVRPAVRVRLGTALSELSRSAGLTNADLEALEQAMRGFPTEMGAPRLDFETWDSEA